MALFSDPLEMTLLEYAAARGVRRQAVRADYTRLMRAGVGIELPAPTRCEQDAGVIKFCLPVTGGTDVWESESVIIPMHSYRGATWSTLCISSQIGCRMGCTFCETGRMGLLRNLSAGEIVRQRLVARQLLRAFQAPITANDSRTADRTDLVTLVAPDALVGASV